MQRFHLLISVQDGRKSLSCESFEARERLALSLDDESNLANWLYFSVSLTRRQTYIHHRFLRQRPPCNLGSQNSRFNTGADPKTQELSCWQ
jgi:hypothetical protein